MDSLSFWHRFDHFLSHLQARREWLTLVVDSLVVGICWNATYLFRLGFGGWLYGRPGYAPLVMFGVMGAYIAAFVALRVPRGLWRFSGFGEVKRLTLACALAGLVSGALVMGLGLVEVPRAVLALHPVL